jgi:hypothetical protein
MSILLLLAAVLGIGVLFTTRAVLWRRRQTLRGFTPLAERTAGSLFEEGSLVGSSLEDGTVRLDGFFAGESIALSARISEATNDAYLSKGLQTGLGADLTVTVGLLGASPRLSFVATKEAVRVADAWDVGGGHGECAHFGIVSSVVRIRTPARRMFSMTAMTTSSSSSSSIVIDAIVVR